MLLTFRHFALLLLPIIHIFCPLIRTEKDHLTKNFMKWSFYLSYILFFTQIIFSPFPHQIRPALHGQPQSDTVHLLLGALPPAPDHGFPMYSYTARSVHPVPPRSERSRPAAIRFSLILLAVQIWRK